MNLTDFWAVYWICIFLYLVIVFITYKLETVVYGGIDNDQIAAGIQLLIISFLKFINLVFSLMSLISLKFKERLLMTMFFCCINNLI